MILQLKNMKPVDLSENLIILISNCGTVIKRKKSTIKVY